MTPQESQLVDDLFDRLAKLENVQRDPDAERLIASGLRRAPHAVYALVQTTLLQDEALRRANARIEELQAQTSGAAEPEQRPASFLDSMREALGGRTPGSVPSVRMAGSYQSQNFQQQGSQPQAGYPPQMPLSGYPGAAGFGSGGSFLGTAASAAAGVIGGALLLDGIRSMFGHHAGMAGASAFGLGDDRSTFADRVQDRQQDLADEDREQDAEQDLAGDDTQQDSEQDLADDEDFAGGDGGFSDDSYDA